LTILDSLLNPFYEDKVMLKQGIILIAFTGSLLSGIASASDHANPRTHTIQSMEGPHIIGWH